MSDLHLYADLVTRKLVSRDGGAVTLPSLVHGDTLHRTLCTSTRNESGDLRPRDLRLSTLGASLGKVLAPPVNGSFALRLVVALTKSSEVIAQNSVIMEQLNERLKR